MTSTTTYKHHEFGCVPLITCKPLKSYTDPPNCISTHRAPETVVVLVTRKLAAVTAERLELIEGV